MSQPSRPRPQAQRTGLDLMLDLAALAGVATSAGLVAWHLPSLPATIPVNFNLAGAPVARGSKQALWVLPAVALPLWMLLAALSRFPHLHNYPWPITEENAERQYRNSVRTLQTVNLLSTWTLAALAWEAIAAARSGSALGSVSLLLPLVGIPAAVLFFVIRGWRLR